MRRKKLVRKHFITKKEMILNNKIQKLLKEHKTPVITFYFNKYIRAQKNVPTQVVTLSDAFLRNRKGKLKSSGQIVESIYDMAHDLNAVDFTI